MNPYGSSTDFQPFSHTLYLHITFKRSLFPSTSSITSQVDAKKKKKEQKHNTSEKRDQRSVSQRRIGPIKNSSTRRHFYPLLRSSITCVIECQRVQMHRWRKQGADFSENACSKTRLFLIKKTFLEEGSAQSLVGNRKLAAMLQVSIQ